MRSDAPNLAMRTKRFAIDIVRVCRHLPSTTETRVIAHQLLRSGTSVGSNYRAVCRARSQAEFIAKIGVVLEEADESAFRLELLVECGIAQGEKITRVLAEANELTAIFAASRITAQKRAGRETCI